METAAEISCVSALCVDKVTRVQYYCKADRESRFFHGKIYLILSNTNNSFARHYNEFARVAARPELQIHKYGLGIT